MDAINDFPQWFSCGSVYEILALLLFCLFILLLGGFYLYKLHRQKKLTTFWMVALGVIALLVVSTAFLFVGEGIYKRNCKNIPPTTG